MGEAIEYHEKKHKELVKWFDNKVEFIWVAFLRHYGDGGGETMAAQAAEGYS